MRSEKINELLSALGADKIKVKDRVVECRCLLGRHADRRRSFFVMSNDNSLSTGKCHSCQWSGSLYDLVRDVRGGNKELTESLLRFVWEHEPTGMIARVDRMHGGLYEIPKLEPREGGPQMPVTNGPDYSDPLSVCDAFAGLPDSTVELVDTLVNQLDSEAMYYLRSKRRLSDAAIKGWRLGWHPIARRISIPQYDRNQRLVNLSGRHLPSILDGWNPLPWMHARGFKKELFLFGEDKFLSYTGKGTLFLVEGMFDAIYLTSVGIPNVAAMCGSSLSKYQIEKIVRWFDRLVIVPDGDEPGWESAKKIRSIMEPRMTQGVFTFPTPSGLDPDELSDEEINDIKHQLSIDFRSSKWHI